MRLSQPGSGFEDFRDRDPLVINEFLGSTYANTTFRAMSDYTVPAARRCVIERIDLLVSLDGTVAAGGTFSVFQVFTPSGGIDASVEMMKPVPGDGPGRLTLFGLWFGQMLPGDRLRVFLTTLNVGITGDVDTLFHGVEYDE